MVAFFPSACLLRLFESANDKQNKRKFSRAYAVMARILRNPRTYVVLEWVLFKIILYDAVVLYEGLRDKNFPKLTLIPSCFTLGKEKIQPTFGCQNAANTPIIFSTDWLRRSVCMTTQSKARSVQAQHLFIVLRLQFQCDSGSGDASRPVIFDPPGNHADPELAGRSLPAQGAGSRVLQYL